MFSLKSPLSIRTSRWMSALLAVGLLTIAPVAEPEFLPRAEAAAVSAPGGSCTQDVGSVTGVTVTRLGNDCVVTFTSRTATTWRAPAGISNVRFLVVGGGGSGDRGTCGVYWGRGGGGGQVRDSTLSVVAGTNYSVVVGKGGDGATASCPDVGGNSGAASQFANITASPGLGGQINTAKGGVSGSGLIGGVGSASTLGAGGGGGAGVAGSGKNGGAGVNSDITGATIMYGSGGAGRDNNGTGTASSGGATGNGAAAENRGGGGADYGSGWYAGADGVVIIRYTDYVPMTFPQVAYNPTTLSIGAGIGGRSDTFTATGGSGTRTFALTPVRSGFSIDTSTANGAALVVSSLVATGSYLETITVTDGAGFSVNHVVTVTVAAPVKWSSDNPTSLTTTFGTAAASRLNITGGTSGRVVTLTKPTTVPSNGITVDTSTAISSNYVTLNVSTKVLPGTYSLTVSVIDSSRIRSNQVFTVVVNKLPSLRFTNGTAETTTVVRSGLHLQYEIGQSYSGTGTTVLDLSGNNRHGSVVANPTYSASLGGGSISINGTNNIITRPGVINNSDTLSRFYWIYPRSATQTLLTVCDSTCAYIESELELFNSRLFARVWNLTPVSTQETLTLNTWHYVGYIYNPVAGTTSIYINGFLAASGVNSGSRAAPGEQYEHSGKSTTTRMQTTEAGNYSLGSVHYYKRALTEAEIYSNYAATAPRFLSTAFPGLSASGSATITTTQGLASSHSLFTATEGTGGKTITLSSATAGITLDTSTANSAILNIANTVEATNSTTQRTISTSVVATDSVTAATTYPLTLRINPPVIISAAIPLTLTTTFGRVAYDTFTATQGTGNKTFTGVSSSFQSAFVVTNPSTNVGLLTVANNLPFGTYLETITATDSLGAKTDYVLTVIINPAPIIVGAMGNTVTTTLSRATSLRINVTGGTGARTISWTSPNAGITIDSSTITSQNFITLNVSANVPVRTYSFAISAVDSLSVRSSDTFTVIVNRWPVIGPATSVSSNLRLSLDSGNASSYSGSGTGWNDLSGNSNNATWQVSPTYIRDFDGVFSHTGATNQFATTPNLGTSDVFSVETWVRFDSLNAEGNPVGSGFPCVVTDDFLLGVVNYSICFTGNNEIRGGYWRTSEQKWVYTPGFTPTVGTWYHFVYTVNTSGSDYVSTLYQNGNLVGSTTDQMVPGNSGGSTYIGKRWGAFTEYVKGSIPIVRVYSQALSRTEVIQNYNAQGSRFITTNSGSETLTVTQGVAGSLSGVVASQGTGNKTFALSNTNAGISIDTSTANAFSLALANTLTATSTTVARILTETVTATDTAGAATTRVYSVVINPPVIETATSTSIATTSGVETTTVIYATQGTGNKTFALSGANSGFTLTSGVSQAMLRVLSTANPGTYNLSVTATDSLGANTSLPITVVVSPPPTLLGVSRIELTQGVGFTSPIYAVSGGTGTLSMTITNSPINSRITLTGVTSTGGYILVESSTATGTYLSTVRVTDARGSFSELVVTIVVNAPVTLSGSLSLTKTYGTSVSSGYSTNGTGTAPFSFSATPICAVVRTVSGSFTFERINGTDSCTWTAPVGVTSIDALIVGAGGGGGGDGGAGGGGGSINTLSSVTLPENRSLTVQVGSGGVGGVWGGSPATAGGTTSLTSGSISYTAPGGSGGGGCGSAAASGGVVGSGGSGTVGGNGGFGATGSGCGGGTGGVGSAGPTSSFTGSPVNYGGGGGGGPYPDSTASIGGRVGGAGGGGTGAVAKGYTSIGLSQYFRTFGTTPANANTKPTFISGTCAVTTGNINYTTDSEFPCAQKDNFQGYAAGYFVSPITGSVKFYLRSDDSSHMTITIDGTTHEFSADNGENSATYSGFVANQQYPISVFFTERGGLARWILEYEYTGQVRTPIPSIQLRPEFEGLTQYFKSYGSQPALASTKTVFTSDTCGSRIGTINYSTDSQFPCAQKDNFHGYATGYFVAPYTGDIKFVLNSDDSSYLTINIDGTTREFGTTIGEASSTYSGFVQGRYYPISVFFTEISGLASWKLSYEYAGQARSIIPTTYLRTAIDYTAPTAGTNGLGGGGGGGSAGLYKLTGASGGSGTAILKYLTQSETATQTMITAIVNQQTPSGLLTLNVPEFVNVGTYTQTIRVQDAANSAPYQAVVTITINKATPTLTLSLPGSVTTAKYGNPVTISAIATTAGTVAFVNDATNITACTAVATTAGLATCSWTPTVVGSTTLRATLTPTDTANYNSSAQVNLPITVAKADTLTVTVASQTLTYTGSVALVTGAFATTGLVAIDSLTAISMLYSGTANNGNAYSNTTAPTSAGTYTISPNFPANASAYTFVAGSLGTISAISNYESITVIAGTLTIERAPQVMSFIYPDTNTATYSPTGTITPSATTRLDSAPLSYSSSTLTKCTIDSATAVISIVEAGSCQVAMVVEQTFNYLADTATATVTINKASRTFSLTPAVATLKYADTTTVTATLSAGALDGTISYTLGSPAGCTFDPLSGELLAISGTIQCPLTATISEGINYLAETTTAISLTIAPAIAPVITIDTITAMDHTPGIRAIVIPTYNISGLKNADTANSLTFTYSFISNPFESFTYSDTRTPIDAGTYRITPSALTLSTGLMSNYETPTYSSSAINFIINRIAQESVTIVTTNGEVEVPLTLQATGGSTDGAVTFTKISGASCSVIGGSLSATASGICVLSVTRAGNRNYLPFTSESITVMVRNFVIFQVTAPANPVTGITIAPTTPIVKGPDICSSGCVPTLVSADIYDVAEGDLIILTGTNLLTVTKVYFNIYTEAPNFTANSDTEVAVRVPADLPQGDATIEVVSPGGTSNRLFDFIILP